MYHKGYLDVASVYYISYVSEMWESRGVRGVGGNFLF